MKLTNKLWTISLLAVALFLVVASIPFAQAVTGGNVRTIQPVIQPISDGESSIVQPISVGLTPTGSGSSSPLLFYAPLTSDMVDTEGAAAPTFDRDSAATYNSTATGYITNATADNARYEWNGLLLEPAATNLIPYSENINTWWTKYSLTGISVAAIESPDGTNNAYGIIGNASDAEHRLYRNWIVLADPNTTYTFSAFMKPGDKTWAMLSIGWNKADNTYLGVERCYFDLQNSIIGTQSFPVSSEVAPFIIPGFNNDFSLVGFSLKTGALVGKIGSGGPGSAHADNDATFAGDAVTTNTYFWGISVTAGNATSYIPTAGATVTRATEDGALSEGASWALSAAQAAAVRWTWTVDGDDYVWLTGPDTYTKNGGACVQGDCPIYPIIVGNTLWLGVNNAGGNITELKGWSTL